MSQLSKERLRVTWIQRALLTLCAVALLSAVIVMAHAAQLRRSAHELIISAKQIHSTADAEREIRTWRQRVGRGYSESRSPDGKGLAYQVQVGNGLLSRLPLIPSAGALLQVTTFSGQLNQVLVGVYTDKSSVWVQEDFSGKSPEQLYIKSERDSAGKAAKTILMFTSDVAAEERENAFALNAACLVKPGGCPHAEDILPTLPLLQNSAQTSSKAVRPTPPDPNEQLGAGPPFLWSALCIFSTRGAPS